MTAVELMSKMVAELRSETVMAANWYGMVDAAVAASTDPVADAKALGIRLPARCSGAKARREIDRVLTGMVKCAVQMVSVI